MTDPKPSPESPQTPESALAAQRDDLLARLQRVSADYLNYQKRMSRQMEEERQFATAALIQDLVPVLDDLERAIQHAAETAPDDPLLAGTRLVLEKALAALGRHGLTVLRGRGQPFDPTRHEAVLQQGGDVTSPTVVEDVLPGYELRGRVIRPAKVVVAMPPAPPDEQASEP